MDNGTATNQYSKKKSDEKVSISLQANNGKDDNNGRPLNRLANSEATYPTTQFKLTESKKCGLNRNDLMSIIRESMEKNRLCFQLNG